jgi:hypothetical protein
MLMPQFSIQTRVQIPFGDDDAPDYLLGAKGTVVRVAVEEHRTNETRGRSGYLLTSPWYEVKFDGNNSLILVNEAWLKPL